MAALKRLSPRRAAFLEKGSRNKTTGAEHEKWRKAWLKAWATRREFMAVNVSASQSLTRELDFLLF
jgi:hypothetical protein